MLLKIIWKIKNLEKKRKWNFLSATLGHWLAFQRRPAPSAAPQPYLGNWPNQSAHPKHQASFPSLVQLMRGTFCYSIFPNHPTKMEELILIPTLPHSMPLPAPEPLDADDAPHVRATTAPCRARSCRSLSHRNRTDPVLIPPLR
jgi:hypothetical protein